MEISLIQPRHTYAPDTGVGHVYMPTSLLTAGARLLEAGCNVDLQDLNFSPMTETKPHVGINLIGTPYIPRALQIIRALNEQHGLSLRAFIGGQVVSGLSSTQFSTLFGKNSLLGNDDQILANELNFSIGDLPRPEAVSLIKAYERIPIEYMRAYLSNEFSFYLSQGCKYACDFCAAVRSHKEPQSGKVNKVVESYRQIPVIEADLQYLSKKALEFGIKTLHIYLSNLDLFQNPSKLNEFARVASKVLRNNPEVTFNLRGLSTVESFLHAHTHHPQVIEEMVQIGLYRLGFGIDGATAEVWNAVHKTHNSEDKCFRAIQIARREYGLVPESLVVFGHPDIDDEKSLSLAVKFSKEMYDQYGSIPRPHVAKNFLPGNFGWRAESNQRAVGELINNPESFQSLDLLALASRITHPNKSQREAVNEAFLELCDNPESPSQSILPILPELSESERAEVRQANKGKYDL